jgi:predicted TIM-barrel fold metal-dependent hydrolase
MKDLRVISADSHVMEPADLWSTRLDRSLRDQAPTVVKNEDEPGYSFVAPGLPRQPVAGAFAAGKSGTDYKAHLEQAGYDAAHPGGWDPAARLDAQATDGVVSEVLYTTLGMRLYRMPDAALQQSCFAVFNEWLAEYCAHSPKRLLGIGAISLWDVAAGVAELERCAKLGLRGGMIWGYPPPDRPYHQELYDPLWAAAQDLGMPLSLHVVTGMGAESRVDFSDAPMRYMGLIHEVQRSLSDIVLGGVLERFPKLQIVSAESDTGWLPHFMQRLDRANEKFGVMLGDRLSLRPSEYVRRQVWATFLDDPVGAAYLETHGEDTFMWGSDFPHSDSTWPDSREVIEKNLAGVPDRVARKLVHDNVAKLYGIELDETD